MSKRTERVADLIRREMAELLIHKLRDPRLGFVSVTSVEVSGDLSSARVFLSSMAGEEHSAELLAVLRKAVPFLRHELAPRLGLREVPQLSFTYDANHRVTGITDSINRQVSVTYADFQTTFADTITFKGFGQASRTVTMNYSFLSNAFRPGSGFTVQTYAQLFPELNGSSLAQYNPYVVSSVVLPGGSLQYQFYYNSYAELARVLPPTGGAIEYDAASGSGAVTDGFDYQIFRRVAERRVFPDGNTLEGKVTYSSSYLSGVGDVRTGEVLVQAAYAAQSADPSQGDPPMESGGALSMSREINLGGSP